MKPRNPSTSPRDVIPPQLEELKREALSLGATAAAIIPAGEIRVKNELAALCNGEYKCPNHGLAAGCPPHVEGPDQFRKWQAQSRYAVSVKIELPASVLYSHERKEVMQLLHQLVAGVEKKAVEMNFTNSRAFAGGSCKQLFCDRHPACRVVAEKKPCRRPDTARPSMSGFGIDVIRLMTSSGWPHQKTSAPEASDAEETGWVAGLILIA